MVMDRDAATLPTAKEKGPRQTHRVVTGREFVSAIRNHREGVKALTLCSPYLKREAVGQIIELFQKRKNLKIRVITKLDPIDMLTGSTDKEAFEELIRFEKMPGRTVEIFVVPNLHAKVILVGQKMALVGSANITNAGFGTNAELGMMIYGKDSKIETLTRRLNDFCRQKNRLDPKRLHRLWNRISEGAPKAKEIMRALAQLKKQFAQGLTSFASKDDDGERLGYADAVFQFLAYLGPEGRTRSECMGFLKERAILGGESINEDRILLLLHLDLCDEEGNLLVLTNRGQALVEDRSTRDMSLYEALAGLFPEFEDILKNMPLGEAICPSDSRLKKWIGREHSKDFFANQMRWLESLGALTSERDRKGKKYIVNPKWRED